jgi:hypothetical protein
MYPRVLIRTIAIAGLVLATAGCLTKSGEPSTPLTEGSPATSATSPAIAPPSAAPAPVTGLGVGNYAVGATLEDLKAAGILTQVNEDVLCKVAFAEGAGVYAGVVSLMFLDGKVVTVFVDSPDISTVDGAKVGMTLAEIKAIYGTRATELTRPGRGGALSVREGEMGLLFLFDDADQANMIQAGRYDFLELNFLEGEDC